MYTENFERLEERITKAVERIAKLKEERDELSNQNLLLQSRIAELETALQTAATPQVDPEALQQKDEEIQGLVERYGQVEADLSAAREALSQAQAAAEEASELHRKVADLVAENASLKTQIEENGRFIEQRESEMRGKLVNILDKLDELED